MNNRYLYAIAAFLFLATLSVMAYKALRLDFPLTSQQTNTLWQIDTRIRLKTEGGPQRVSLRLPRDTERFVINDEDFFSGKFGLSVVDDESGKTATWTVRDAAGWNTLFYRSLIEPVQTTLGSSNTQRPATPVSDFSDIESDIADAILTRAKDSSADTRSFVFQLMSALQQRYSMDDLGLLLPTDEESNLPLLIRLLAREGIAARQANGLLLNRQSPGIVNTWLQVYFDNEWHLFNQATRQEVPDNEALVIWTGDEPHISTTGASAISVVTVIEPRDENLLDFFQFNKNENRHWLIDYSFFSLPLSTQRDFQVLVTIPIGVLLLVVLRNIIGVKTFGTFLPVLVALSFRDTGLITGIILFTMIVFLGLLTRIALDKLSLLLVPRVGSILIVVLIVMLCISVLSFKLGIETGLSVTLFPMVILAIMIERMSILWDERGPFEVFLQSIGTIVVAAMAYYIMHVEWLQHIMFVFPELLLATLAVTMLLGRYTGFKLTELFRFRALVDSAATRRA